MLRLIRAANRVLSAHNPLFVIGAAVLAFFLPELFSWVKGNVSSAVLGVIMLSMGVTLTADDLKRLLKRPADIALGACAQYTIMPLIAFALTRAFGLNPYLAVGIVLVGCCPGGVSSNVMSFLARGDVAFSVGMTTVSTLLSPFVTPLLVLWRADTSIHVNAFGMFLNILWVTIFPVTAGFLLNHFLGRRPVFGEIRANMPSVSVVGLAVIVGGVVATVRPHLVSNGAGLLFLMLAVVFCHNALGYLLGFGVGALFRFDRAKRRTIAIEVGVQNAGMATVLAATFFANPENLAADPLAALCVVPCAISCAYHSISGTVLAGLFVRADRLREKKGA